MAVRCKKRFRSLLSEPSTPRYTTPQVPIRDHESQGHISCLFPEILTIIFSYLDVQDRGRVARVCHAWKEAAYKRRVWKGVEARLHLRRNHPALFPSLVQRDIQVFTKINYASANQLLIDLSNEIIGLFQTSSFMYAFLISCSVSKW
jgi:F-box/leucine-rich repeat protein 14